MSSIFGSGNQPNTSYDQTLKRLPELRPQGIDAYLESLVGNMNESFDEARARQVDHTAGVLAGEVAGLGIQALLSFVPGINKLGTVGSQVAKQAVGNYAREVVQDTVNGEGSLWDNLGDADSFKAAGVGATTGYLTSNSVTGQNTKDGFGTRVWKNSLIRGVQYAGGAWINNASAEDIGRNLLIGGTSGALSESIGTAYSVTIGDYVDGKADRILEAGFRNAGDRFAGTLATDIIYGNDDALSNAGTQFVTGFTGGVAGESVEIGLESALPEAGNRTGAFLRGAGIGLTSGITQQVVGNGTYNALVSGKNEVPLFSDADVLAIFNQTASRGQQEVNEFNTIQQSSYHEYGETIQHELQQQGLTPKEADRAIRNMALGQDLTQGLPTESAVKVRAFKTTFDNYVVNLHVGLAATDARDELIRERASQDGIEVNENDPEFVQWYSDNFGIETSTQDAYTVIGLNELIEKSRVSAVQASQDLGFNGVAIPRTTQSVVLLPPPRPDVPVIVADDTELPSDLQIDPSAIDWSQVEQSPLPASNNVDEVVPTPQQLYQQLLSQAVRYQREADLESIELNASLTQRSHSAMDLLAPAGNARIYENYRKAAEYQQQADALKQEMINNGLWKTDDLITVVLDPLEVPLSPPRPAVLAPVELEEMPEDETIVDVSQYMFSELPLPPLPVSNVPKIVGSPSGSEVSQTLGNTATGDNNLSVQQSPVSFKITGEATSQAAEYMLYSMEIQKLNPVQLQVELQQAQTMFNTYKAQYDNIQSRINSTDVRDIRTRMALTEQQTLVGSKLKAATKRFSLIQGQFNQSAQKTAS